MVKNLPAIEAKEARVRSLEEGMATHSSILALRIPWTEEPGGVQSMGHKELDMTEVTEHSTHALHIPERQLILLNERWAWEQYAWVSILYLPFFGCMTLGQFPHNSVCASSSLRWDDRGYIVGLLRGIPELMH